MSSPTITFETATLKDVNFPDTTKRMKAVAIVQAPLTADVAKHLKCGHLFKKNGDPVDAVGKYSPPIKLADVEFKLPSGSTEGVDTYRPEIIRSFTVTPKDDLNLMVEFRVHITGVDRAYELLATRAKYLGKKLDCSLRSLQEEFNFTDAVTTGEAEDDDADEPPLLAGCKDCDNKVPRNADGLHMFPGGKRVVACPLFKGDDGDDDEPAGPAIASRQQMGIKKTRQPRKRRAVAPPTDAEVEASVSVQ